jgi:hypothetical protein
MEYNLASTLFDMTKDVPVPPGAKLYVASECKTQRDIFRNSGYTIKLDPAVADVIVVPDIIPSKYHCEDCNIVATDQGDEYLFLITITKAGYSMGKEITGDDIFKVKNYLATLRNYKFDYSTLNNLKVWFIPKCDELKDVMLGVRKYNAPYLQEHLLPISASTKFSPETLMYWKNIAAQDQELLARTICTSDWRKYPVTLLVFLYTNGKRTWNNFGNSDFRNILNNIGYVYYYGLESALCDEDISPKDYDMLQSYLYYLMGIDEEKGGMVDQRTIDSVIHKDLLPLLQRRYIFKPLHLSTKMKTEAVEELVK